MILYLQRSKIYFENAVGNPETFLSAHALCVSLLVLEILRLENENINGNNVPHICSVFSEKFESTQLKKQKAAN